MKQLYVHIAVVPEAQSGVLRAAGLLLPRVPRRFTEGL